MLAQRRQQSHDPKLWKGLCHPLDLTTFLKDARYPFSISICTKEAIEKPETQKYKVGTPVSKLFEDEDGEERPFAGTVKRYDAKFKLYQILYEDGDAEELTDDEVAKILVKKEEAQSLLGSYGIHLAVCEYIGPDDLCVQLMGTMQKISLETSQRMAKRYLEKQTVSMIDSDGEDGNSGGSSSLTFSLLCHLSRKAIDIPVRGKNCKHMQCFDLKSFLHSNSHVSGGRWRCAVCEDFLSVRDLVHCGLFKAMLNDHRDKVSGARDKVSFKPDLTWCMKDANKLRYAGKSRGIGDNEGGDTQVKEQAIEGADVASQKRSVSQPEVIDLS